MNECKRLHHSTCRYLGACGGASSFFEYLCTQKKTNNRKTQNNMQTMKRGIAIPAAVALPFIIIYLVLVWLLFSPT